MRSLRSRANSLAAECHNAGPYAAMLLAASRGNMDGYKTALAQSYGPAAKRVYEKTVDAAYEHALKEASKLMDTTDAEEEETLVFWATVAENYEDRHCPMGIADGET